MISAVAFDMDGLMFDTESVYKRCGAELMRRRGKDYSPELCHAVMGTPPKSSFTTMIQWHSLNDTWEELQTESDELFLELLQEGFEMMPGLPELLEVLDQWKIPKGICTSSAKKIATAVLKVHDMERQFDFVMTAEDIFHGKPNPEIYLKAAKRFGILPQNMMVLEDSVFGSLAAKDSGAFTVVVLADHNKTQDFSHATLVVERLNDPRVLEKLRGYCTGEKK